MDIHLPGIDGVECVRRFKTALPETQFLMLTVYEESAKIFESLLAGACGYLLKRTSTAESIEAIRPARAGGSPLACGIARKGVAHFNRLGVWGPRKKSAGSVGSAAWASGRAARSRQDKGESAFAPPPRGPTRVSEAPAGRWFFRPKRRPGRSRSG